MFFGGSCRCCALPLRIATLAIFVERDHFVKMRNLFLTHNYSSSSFHNDFSFNATLEIGVQDFQRHFRRKQYLLRIEIQTGVGCNLQEHSSINQNFSLGSQTTL